MKSFGYIVKITAWSLAVNAVLRIVFGAYSVYRTPVLIVPIILGITSAVVLTTSDTYGLVISSLSHMTLVSVIFGLSDRIPAIRNLSILAANVFASFSEIKRDPVDILWCIFFIMPVYFITYVIFSAIISDIKIRISEKNKDEVTSIPEKIARR